MKRFTCAFYILIAVFSTMAQTQLYDAVVFASEDQGKVLLLTEDEYTRAWSPFDVQARLQDPKGTKESLFRLIEKEVLPWSPKDLSAMQRALKRIDYHLYKLNIKLEIPDTLFFIQTSGDEEGGATAYTRRNCIVFKQGSEKKAKQLERLIIHEIFHVLSRQNPTFRAKMYEVIGFKMMAEVDYPEGIRSMKITNPDAPINNAFIELTIEGKTAPYMMVIYSDREYTSGRFFEYLKTGLMELEGASEKKPVLRDGQPNILEIKSLKPFFKKVGMNTEYNIHPEEIMAENFSFALTAKHNLINPEIIVKINSLLQAEK